MVYRGSGMVCQLRSTGAGHGAASYVHLGVALLQGLAEPGRCGLAGHAGKSSPSVSGRSEEMSDGFVDRRIASA
jgi:hypothetical protein